MSNTLTDLEWVIFAQGLPSLRERAILPRYVYTDYSTEAQQKGASIRISKPSLLTTRNVVPGPTIPAAQDAAPDVATINLNNWIETTFHLNADEERRIAAGTTFVPGMMTSAFRAIGNALNTGIINCFSDVYGFCGTPGTTPFASDLSALAALSQTLDTQLCPDENRAFIMSVATRQNALNLAQFTQAQMVGSDEGIAEGRLGRKLGFTTDWTQTMGSHIAGNASSYVLAQNYAAGQGTGIDTTSSLTLQSGSGTFNIGDIITIGSGGGTGTADTQTYVVTGVPTPNTVINIQPGLALAHVTNDTITVKATHTYNMGFHREAFALAIRATDPTYMPPGTRTGTMVEPITGIPVRLDVMDGYEQRIYRVSVLFGYVTMRREYAARLAG